MEQARLVPYPDARAQVRAVCTLGLRSLTAWIANEVVLGIRAQERLVLDPRVAVRTELARHRHLVADVQERLALDTNQYVRRTLASNRSLTARAAYLLFDGMVDGRAPNSYPYVLAKLAANARTPSDALVAIFHDPPSVLATWSVLANPSFPLDAAGPLGYLDDRSQQLVARRGVLSLTELGQLRAQNVSPDILHASARASGHLHVDLLVRRSDEFSTVGDLLGFVDSLQHLPAPVAEAVFKLEPDWEGFLVDLPASACLL